MVAGSGETVPDPQQKTRTRKLLEGWHWYRPGISREEKILVFKLDLSILLFGCLSTFTKTLDNQALTNAYVTGMREDIGLTGNDLNYLNAVYYSSYLSFMIPASFMLTRLPISKILPTMEILWGVCTFGCAWVHNLTQLYVCRFFLGATETVAFTGVIYVIGSWYKRDELGTRMALFQISAPLGSMISGYLQTAAYTHLNGRHGIEGWRWMFIICFCITFPCAIIGYVCFPNQPNNTRPSWLLNHSEVELANKRLEEEGVMKMEKKINWRALTRVLKGWPWYCFVFAWCLYDQNQYWGTTPFSLYLKASDRHYSPSQINDYPTVGKGIAIVLTVIGSYYSDKTGDRFGPTLLGAILVASGSIILVVWNVPEGARFYAFFIDGAETAMSTFLMSWASDVVKHDSEARSIITASMNCIGQVFLAWVPIFTFNVAKAPRFTVGFIFSMVTGIVHVLLACLIQVLDVRRKRKENKRMLLIEARNDNKTDVFDDVDVEGSVSSKEKQ
ncbi:major facilitator superfamily domain-containing protein [Lipomyces tetrasporus]|uniref:Major facilitator superfamily domain-containing protein n=1 Tax=Lipomyces tetrasporus TaxID=54092 RepID=A0AAD7VUP8_9ASCO|nr:major facilitator superfamily domain-containing protein [Lipomyces tetrasporus]KAJ8102069.1 major facilitator superfamily domain-containing protein [Lipomyces tetrasporus]